MRTAIVLVFLGCLVLGCASEPLKISTLQNTPSSKYQVLGPGEGEAVGIMLFGVIPIMQNERFVRAYDMAVKSRGGTRLIDPVIEERWFWGFILDGFATKISGTVVKDIK